MKQAYDLHTVHSTILQKEEKKTTMSFNYTTTVVSMGKWLGQTQGLSKPPDCQRKYEHILLVESSYEFHMHSPRQHIYKSGKQ